ncbi:MAG: tRNA-dihydrouridine synthase, partial [Planctomycetota bacterium]
MNIGPLIVDPPLLQAPMAGFSNYAYRQILRRFGGVGLPATEMVSARGLLLGDVRSRRFAERLWGVIDEPRPLAVQIWDNDPGLLAEAGARMAGEFGASVVDVNFGCPVRKVSEKAKSGSHLLRDPERVGALVGRVVEACRPT